MRIVRTVLTRKTAVSEAGVVFQVLTLQIPPRDQLHCGRVPVLQRKMYSEAVGV